MTQEEFDFDEAKRRQIQVAEENILGRIYALYHNSIVPEAKAREYAEERYNILFTQAYIINRFGTSVSINELDTEVKKLYIKNKQEFMNGGALRDKWGLVQFNGFRKKYMCAMPFLD